VRICVCGSIPVTKSFMNCLLVSGHASGLGDQNQRQGYGNTAAFIYLKSLRSYCL